jgi:hypothetical protein
MGKIVRRLPDAWEEAWWSTCACWKPAGLHALRLSSHRMPWSSAAARRSAQIVPKGVTAENYSGVGSPDETNKATNHLAYGAKPIGQQPHTALARTGRPYPTRLLGGWRRNWKTRCSMNSPLSPAVPRPAQLSEISRAAAYRLVASDELPGRRLCGRFYVVTAGLREPVAS